LTVPTSRRAQLRRAVAQSLGAVGGRLLGAGLPLDHPRLSGERRNGAGQPGPRAVCGCQSVPGGPCGRVRWHHPWMWDHEGAAGL